MGWACQKKCAFMSIMLQTLQITPERSAANRKKYFDLRKGTKDINLIKKKCQHCCHCFLWIQLGVFWPNHHWGSAVRKQYWCIFFSFFYVIIIIDLIVTKINILIKRTNHPFRHHPGTSVIRNTTMTDTVIIVIIIIVDQLLAWAMRCKNNIGIIINISFGRL